jgi:hypothetical protein
VLGVGVDAAFADDDGTAAQHRLHQFGGERIGSPVE